MAKIIEITNPLTGQPQPAIQSDYTAQQIDDAVAAVQPFLPGGPGLPVNQGGTGANNPQAALVNLGARPSRNFADNSRFSNNQVVNQRGQTTYTNGSISASIDRWKLLGTMTLEENGLSIQKTQSAPEFFVQAISDEVLSALRGQTVTLSAVYNDGDRKIAGSTFVVPAQGDIDSPEASIGDVLFDLYKSSGDANARIRFFSASPSTSLTLEAVELVIGNHQTVVYTDSNGYLQFIDNPNYWETLAQCQRQLYIPATGTASTYYSAVINPTSGDIFFPVILPVPMRATPVVTVINATLYVGTEQKTVTASAITCYALCGNQALCRANGVAAGASARTGIVEIGGLQLSAEL